jgi:hypothetical protein
MRAWQLSAQITDLRTSLNQFARHAQPVVGEILHCLHDASQERPPHTRAAENL